MAANLYFPPIRGIDSPIRPFSQAMAEVITARTLAGVALPAGYTRGRSSIYHEVECPECHGEGEYEVQVSETRFRRETCIECSGSRTVQVEIEIEEEQP